jgi:glutamate dehydrogenase (NADP+)
MVSMRKLAYLMNLKNVRRGRIAEYAQKYQGEYHEGKRPWGVKADIAFPCATQNEIDENDAREMIKNGVMAVCEGANMPTTLAATKLFQEHKVLFSPGKASNAGGVAVSGLEQTQNALRLSWTREEVDAKLQEIMRSIHSACVNYGQNGSHVDYVKAPTSGASSRSPRRHGLRRYLSVQHAESLVWKDGCAVGCSPSDLKGTGCHSASL